MYKRISLALLFGITFFNLFAQSVERQLSRNLGILYRETAKNNDIAGSPFLFDEWKTGTVVLENNERYDNIKLKYDAHLNRFFYTQHDLTFELVSDVSQIRLKDPAHFNDSTYDMVFKKNLTAADDSQISGFVEELCNGKVNIVRAYKKEPEGENGTNGLVETERKFVLHTRLLAIKNNNVIPIKYNSHTLEDLTSDKQSQVDNFIKSNKLNVKNEKDFIAAVAYYNSLGT